MLKCLIQYVSTMSHKKKRYWPTVTNRQDIMSHRNTNTKGFCSLTKTKHYTRQLEISKISLKLNEKHNVDLLPFYLCSLTDLLHKLAIIAKRHKEKEPLNIWERTCSLIHASAHPRKHTHTFFFYSSHDCHLHPFLVTLYNSNGDQFSLHTTHCREARCQYC